MDNSLKKYSIPPPQPIGTTEATNFLMTIAKKLSGGKTVTLNQKDLNMVNALAQNMIALHLYTRNKGSEPQDPAGVENSN
jgi:hypothetical protein